MACWTRIFLLLAIGFALSSTPSEGAPRGLQTGTGNPAQSNSATSRQTGNETKTHQATPDANGIYEVGDGVSAPKVLSTVNPEYTDMARKKKMSGGCVIGPVVDAQGNPQDIHVARSVADNYEPKLKKIAEGLDQTAMKAVSQYRFNPAEYQGKPVPVHVKIEIRFQIY
jgi:TonB family protein